ncbi:MAG: 30S ribosomal protein S6 [bacterium]
MKRRYDGVYFLSDVLKAEALEAACENIRTDIKKAGGAILAERQVERRSFARPLGGKVQAAYCLEIAIELETDKVVILRQRHRLDANLFRVMIVAARPAAKAAPKKVQPEPAQATVA